MPPRIAGLLQHHSEERKEALYLTSLSSLRNSSTLMHPSSAHKLIEAYRHRLPQVHRRMSKLLVLVHGNRQQPVTMAKFIITEPRLLRTEKHSHPPARVRKLRTNLLAGLRQRKKRMLKRTLPHGSRAHDKGAIRDRFSNTRTNPRVRKHGRGINSRARRLERNGVVVDNTQKAKTKVVHRPRRRAYVVGIACTHQNNDQPIELFRTEHSRLL